ncbi:MAG TPA: hypothetical protein VM695_08415 [Phycisphaerae bacterium]|nr:hypothetical protein [Phycisphaerae bacterium]
MRRSSWFEPRKVCALAVGVVACVLSAGASAQAAPPTTAPALADGARIAVTRPGTFEIHVQGADLRGVLQLLSTQGKRNIIATKEVQGTVTADLYGVTFEQALKAVLASSGFDYVDEDGFIYVHTLEQKAAILKAKVEAIVKVFHLSYITAADAQTLVAPALSENGSAAVTPAAAVGINQSQSDTGGNSNASSDVLVVRDLPKRVEAVGQLLAELDIKPKQVLVEATILSTGLKEFNKLGVNFNVLAGVDFQDLGFTATSTGNPSTTSGNLRPSAINFRTDFQPITGGMTFGVFGSDVAFFISALETVTDVTVLANPKLLVVNKQRGEVMIGQRDGYVTTTVTENTATETVEFLETGTRLLVRPFIANDRYIRMEIHPEDSDGGVEGGLPSESTTEVTSNVLVRDGHTIIIGGLFREKTSISKNQVPVLGNIPYLGTLFRTNNDGTERDEVIILITPHIINHPVDEAVSDQMRDDAERVRVGQRQGLRWWATDRLAQGHYRSAKQALRAGDQQKALWWLDLSLAHRPSMIEAIRLKEQVTRKTVWSDEARNSVAKFAIQRMIMQDLGRPVEEVVIPSGKPGNAEGLDPAVKEALGIQPRVLPPLLGTSRKPVAPQPVTPVTAAPKGAEQATPAKAKE